MKVHDILINGSALMLLFWTFFAKQDNNSVSVTLHINDNSVLCVFLCAGGMPTPRHSPVEEREVLSGEGRSNNNNMATDTTTSNLLASVKEQVCRTVSICQCLAVGEL